MKTVDKLAVALRECERCGNLIVFRYGVPEEHTSKGQPCRSERLAGSPSQAKSSALG